MQLSPAQIMLIKKSWSIFRIINPELVGEVFYSRLFYKQPSLKKLFHSSMTEQYTKLINMFTLIISRLERMDEIDAELQELALRHTGYGVKQWHYEAVGEALLWTLQQGLNNDWNDEMAEAWYNCYSILSGSVINATKNNTITNLTTQKAYLFK